MSYASVIEATTGLTYYWRLQETSGTEAKDKKDSNPGKYEGTYTLGQTGPTTEPDKAVFVNGTNGKIPTEKTLTGETVLSVEAWINCAVGVNTNRMATS